MSDDVVRDYLDDILDATEKIERYTENLNFEEFEDDAKTADAVLRNFEVIGEAAKNVPDAVRDEYDDIPWAEMAGMRDKLIHGYATVDLEIIWRTVENDIPPLHSQIAALREDFAPE